MKTECNESQMKALVAGLDHSPVVLIQVPDPAHAPFLVARCKMILSRAQGRQIAAGLCEQCLVC